MAIYVYNAASGALVSWCPSDTDPVASQQMLAANGLAAVSGLPALDATHAWSAATKTVVVVAAPPTPNWLPTYEFVLLFQPAETAAIRASQDQTVQQFLLALTVAPQVDLNSATIQNAVNYLASVNLLTQARATAILGGT